jgi:hypothetical protein
VIALPPLEAGAVQDTTEYPERYEDAETPVGAPGTVADVPTVAGAEATEGSLVPTLFVAVTVRV